MSLLTRTRNKPKLRLMESRAFFGGMAVVLLVLVGALWMASRETLVERKETRIPVMLPSSRPQ
jgi:hypothetical protein